MHETKKGFYLTLIIPAIIAIAVATIVCIAISGGESATKAGDIAITLVITVLLYLMSVQLLWWDGIVCDIFDFFMVKPFSKLGLIFELSLDGIIWFILVKIGLSILSFIISVIIGLIGILICMVVAPFAFPFALKDTIADIK